MTKRRWISHCASVTGASHLRRNLPNQDFIDICSPTDFPSTCIIAVADGHGSEECSRSQDGARIAVECAISVLEKFLRERDGLSDRLATNDDALVLERLNREFRRSLVPDIVHQWREKVVLHYQNLRERTPTNEASSIYRMYGTTLNVVAVTEELYISLKIGDGNILFVFKDQKVAQPFQESKYRVGDETESLCQSDATEVCQFRVSRFGNTASQDLALVLVCSDGFTNAFDSREGFLKAATDFANLASTEDGIKTLNSSLEGWLNEYSQFSGDDVSLGIIASKLH